MSVDAELTRDPPGPAEVSGPDERRVIEALGDVLDPCSCMTDSPVSIVELGLVEDVTVTEGVAELTLVPTTPMCLYMTQIIDDADAAVGSLDGIDAVRIEQDVTTMWRPSRMAPSLRERHRQSQQGEADTVFGGAE
jgi:metal-sulfur cluster biosynthetic enzyme